MTTRLEQIRQRCEAAKAAKEAMRPLEDEIIKMMGGYPATTKKYDSDIEWLLNRIERLEKALRFYAQIESGKLSIGPEVKLIIATEALKE